MFLKEISLMAMFFRCYFYKQQQQTQKGWNSNLSAGDSDFRHRKESSCSIKMSLLTITRDWSGLTKAHNDTDVRKRQS